MKADADLSSTGQGCPLGLNMHPRWLGDGRVEDFLAWLKELGVSALEFKPIPYAPDWPEVRSLIETGHRQGFQITFHAPHKPPHNPIGFSGARREEVERLYRPALTYAARLAEATSPAPLVVHGAKGPRPRAELRRDTISFLSWIATEFPTLHPAIELLARNKAKVGDNKAELVEIVSELGLPQVGICWDLGHDARNGAHPPPRGFISLVRHVHVHDISPAGEDHSPLMFGNVPYRERLRELINAGYTGAVILEVNGQLVARFAAAQRTSPLHVLAASLTRLAGTIAPRRHMAS